MRLDRACALGVFAGVHLAEKGMQSPVQGREISESLGTSHDYLMKILQQLVRARIFTSGRGPTGGFQLRKDPAQITILDIFEAIDGPIAGDALFLDGILGKGQAKAGLESACQDMARFARSTLKKTTIKDLLGATENRVKLALRR